MDERIETLLKSLEYCADNCKDEVVNLKSLEFFCDDEEMYLKHRQEGPLSRKYSFKLSPSDPRNPLIIHAHQQFCKRIGIPHKFFADNRPEFRNEVANNWMKSVSPEEDKSSFLAKLREGRDVVVLRALLPLTHSSITNYDIVKHILRGAKELNPTLDFVAGDTRDELVFHARFIIGDEFEVLGRKCRMGFAVTSSELGASDLIFDGFLFHLESKTAFLGSYGGEPMFQVKYSGIQPNEIKDLIPGLIEELMGERDSYISSVSEAEWAGLATSCRIAAAVKKAPSLFSRSIYLQADAHVGDIHDAFDFAVNIGLVAKDFDPLKRIQVERIAGRFVNLLFDKR